MSAYQEVLEWAEQRGVYELEDEAVYYLIEELLRDYELYREELSSDSEWEDLCEALCFHIKECRPCR